MVFPMEYRGNHGISHGFYGKIYTGNHGISHEDHGGVPVKVSLKPTQ